MGIVARLIRIATISLSVLQAEVSLRLPLSSVWTGLPAEIADDFLAGATSHELRAGETLFEAADKGAGC